MTEESKTKQIKPQGATRLNEEMRDGVTQRDSSAPQVHRQNMSEEAFLRGSFFFFKETLRQSTQCGKVAEENKKDPF